MEPLDEEATLAVGPSADDLAFDEEAPTQSLGPPSTLELSAQLRRAPSVMPIDSATAAEYAQSRRGAPLETPEDIEQELGVDLSLGVTRPPPGRALVPDYSPTPGRASVHAGSRPGSPRASTEAEPFALAPSAPLPAVRPVAPFEPPSHPSHAPPPESMAEPEPQVTRARLELAFDLPGEVLPDRPAAAAPPGPAPPQSTPPPPRSVFPKPPHEDDDDILASAFERIRSIPPAAPPSSLPLPALQAIAPASSQPPAPGLDGIDLLDVRGLQDLSEDAQALLIRRARIVALAVGEEVSSFGVALVTAGSVQLMPVDLNASCLRATKGEVLFTSGTVESSVSLRAVAAEPGTRVAVLTQVDLAEVTSSSPWVLDELAEVADRLNAFGGAVLGPLGRSLDEMFRTMVLDKCTVKNPTPGSLLAQRGKPLHGLYIVGAGSLQILRSDGSLETRLAPGDIVFPETVLSASPAPLDVRVPDSGALLLHAGRMAALELIATCPPFIEILAG